MSVHSRCSHLYSRTFIFYIFSINSLHSFFYNKSNTFKTSNYDSFTEITAKKLSTVIIHYCRTFCFPTSLLGGARSAYLDVQRVVPNSSSCSSGERHQPVVPNPAHSENEMYHVNRGQHLWALLQQSNYATERNQNYSLLLFFP